MQILDSGECYTIRMRVQFKQAITSPIFAFTIKDIKGTEIAGTNTRFSGVDTGEYSAGQVATIEFIQNINLNAGNFLLSLGCVAPGGDKLEIYDRRHDFISFQVVSEKAGVGIIDLDSKIKISTSSSSPGQVQN